MYYEDSQSPRDLSAASRAKRVRTSFKHHQLRTMKSYFAVNQNPDAKDLKQLAQKTGLSKRVLQVSDIKIHANLNRKNIIKNNNCNGIQKKNVMHRHYSFTRLLDLLHVLFIFRIIERMRTIVHFAM